MTQFPETVRGEMRERRCGQCGCVLSSYQKGNYCFPCQEGIRSMPPSESRSQAGLRPYASFYDYGYDGMGEEGSLRRFEEHVRSIRSPWILGLGYDKDVGLIFHCRPGEIQGPIPDVPTKYCLPPGTKGVAVEVCPGAVNGPVYLSRICTEAKHPWFQAWAEEGYSGVIGKIITT